MEKTQLITELVKTDFDKFTVAIALTDEEIIFVTQKELSEDSDFRNLLGLNSLQANNVWLHSARLSPLNAFVFRYTLDRGTKISRETATMLADYADRIRLPEGKLSDDRKHVEITAPGLKVYREILTRLSAYPAKDAYKLRIDKLMELEMVIDTWRSKLPKILLNREVKDLNNAPLIGFDGSIDSLREIPIGSLNVVQANIQGWKALKASKENIESKLTKHGIGTLYDLLFRLPRRYIDKSKPQLIDDLIIGEKATIIGTITSMNEINASVPGLRMIVSDATGTKIAVTFWRQNWLKTKFKVGSEVILNGTVSVWSNNIQLGGDSIEHFDEGITLPVVPIYKQSESAGITSGFLIAAIRELLQRMGDLSLPVYFKNKERENMKEVLSQLHFPSILDTHAAAILDMAY